MKFATLEEAQAAYDELKPKYDALEGEKTSLLKKRDELLGEVKNLKTKFAKFSDYADRDDIDITALLDIKSKFESGDNDAKKQYEQAYNADKAKFEQRLAAIEKERAEEKAQVEREKQETTAAKLKADAISEFSKPGYRIRSPEQFWKLYGEGTIQRGEDGKLFIGDEYKKTSLADYISQVNEDENNSHHFLPKGGSGSGTTTTTGGGGKVTTNPWKRESFNLTQQGQILKNSPELAARLKAEAGAK